MPEGPEIDTDKLREQIDEEIEREDHSLVRMIAVNMDTSTPMISTSANPRIVRACETNDERSVFLDRLEVVHARIPTVGEEQPIVQRGCGREELSLGLLVGGDLDGTNLVGEAAVGGMELHRCRLDGREASWEDTAQLLLERE